MTTKKRKKPVYSVYCMRSWKNKKWYIGITDRPAARRRQHISLRPDLYGPRVKMHIIWSGYSLVAAALLEKQLIEKYQTQEPSGNNKRCGGLTGHLLRYALSRPDCHDSHLPQALKDKIATTKRKQMRRRHNELTKSEQHVRRRNAWKRYRKGLRTLPGDKRYLQQPEYIGHVVLKGRKKARMIQACKQSWAAKIASGYRSPLIGKKRRNWNQEDKDKIAAARIKGSISRKIWVGHGAIRKMCRIVKVRRAQGLCLVPGTEVFLNLKTCFKRKTGYTHAQQKEWTAKMVKQVNCWRIAYGKKMGWIR